MNIRKKIKTILSKSFFTNYMYWELKEEGNKVAITFDDGPTEYTGQILEILRKEETKATFFVLSESIKKYPHEFKNILSEGHKIGIHGSNHEKGNLINQVKECKKILDSLDCSSTLVRPPYGYITFFQFIWCLINGYKIIMWSFDVHDSMRLEGKIDKDPDYGKVKSGDIILMHDDNVLCVKELKKLISVIKRNNLTAIKLDEN